MGGCLPRLRSAGNSPGGPGVLIQRGCDLTTEQGASLCEKAFTTARAGGVCLLHIQNCSVTLFPRTNACWGHSETCKGLLRAICVGMWGLVGLRLSASNSKCSDQPELLLLLKATTVPAMRLRQGSCAAGVSVEIRGPSTPSCIAHVPAGLQGGAASACRRNNMPEEVLTYTRYMYQVYVDVHIFSPKYL